MLSYEERLEALILKLYEIDALKFGDFKMKVGINSPVYFDLRVIVSHPHVMDTLSKLLWEFSKPSVHCQHICGVPYTALPIASLISVHANIPMLIRRKETKDYGTRKLIEGKFKQGDKCVIIEDVVTSGSSILETYRDLQTEGLEVAEAIVVVDREQGGRNNLSEHGLNMRSLCTLSQIMKVLLDKGKVNQATVDSVRNYIKATQIPLKNYLSTAKTQASVVNRLTMTFSERAKLAKNSVAAQLFLLMSEKKTNLCVSADLTRSENILQLAASVGPYICLLKIHADIIKDFTMEFIDKLLDISKKNNFLLMEDRKFSDIGRTACLQYSQGFFNIASWAHLVTVHPLPGPGILNGLSSVVENVPNAASRGCFLVVEMSSQGNLCSSQYISEAMHQATAHSQFVAGVVCQSSKTVCDPGLIQLTPGVQLAKETDSLGQQYKSPEHAVLINGADIAVVGRGVTEADNMIQTAKEYQTQLWKSYEKRINFQQQ